MSSSVKNLGLSLYVCRLLFADQVFNNSDVPLIKKLGRVFASKHIAELLKPLEKIKAPTNV